MVRYLVFYDPPVDPVDFDRHYRDVHVPLAKQLPGLRRFAINRDPQPIRGERPPYLVAELDWDDVASMTRALESPEGRAAAADVPTFASGGVTSAVYELEEL
jgi:uncharacterized protein (TIGR02118 family)